MEEISTRLFNELGEAPSFNTEAVSEFEAEIYTISDETELLMEYLYNIEKEMFVDTAEDIGLSLRESLWGVVRGDLSNAERRDLINRRFRFMCDCICPALFGYMHDLFGYSFTYSSGPDPFTATISVSGNPEPIEKANIIRHIKKLFPIVAKINFIFN